MLFVASQIAFSAKAILVLRHFFDRLNHVLLLALLLIGIRKAISLRLGHCLFFDRSKNMSVMGL
jgi:hypothetical protein